MSQLPPIHREVLVDLDPDSAFELFAARIGDWWPLASHSVFGAGGSVTFTDEKLIETLGDQTAVWGEVIEWRPGTRLVISWHAGHPEAESTRVSVSFTAQGERTLVALEHFGWEARGDPAAIRRQYDQGWPTVIAFYASAAASVSSATPRSG
jgi:uncharacterized protein YndB with AHSA1/START domain